MRLFSSVLLSVVTLLGVALLGDVDSVTETLIQPSLVCSFPSLQIFILALTDSKLSLLKLREESSSHSSAQEEDLSLTQSSKN